MVADSGNAGRTRHRSSQPVTPGPHTPLRKRLTDTAALLETNRTLWEERPFVGLPLTWERRRPALAAALRALSEDDLVKFEANPADIPSLREVEPHLLGALDALSHWPLLTAGSDPPPARRDGVGASKWLQIRAFAEVVTPRIPDGLPLLVDWCAGKGHLGRTMAATTDLSVVAVESSSLLAAAGGALARRENTAVSYVIADVLRTDVVNLVSFTTPPGFLALHACGDLNRRLLEQTAAIKSPFIALIPCCYQRTADVHYRPLSCAARQMDLNLHRRQLRLPALVGATMNDSRKAKLWREHAYRLGVDLLQREITGTNVHVSPGKIAQECVDGGFRTFAEAAFAKLEIRLPTSVDWETWEDRGRTRHCLVRSLSVARRLFSRLLESWLFLDRVCFLEEHGYAVEAGRCFHADASPRNLMLIGRSGIATRATGRGTRRLVD